MSQNRKHICCTLSALAGVAIILLSWDVNWKWWNKCFYENFDILQRPAKRPKCPTSGVIWPGEWGYLADLLFWGRKLILWASKLPRQQWRLFCTHFFRLTPCRTRFRTLWLGYGLSEFNISVISSELDFFVPYTQSRIRILYYVRTCIFSLRRRTYKWWKGNFWKRMGRSIAF